MMKGLTVMTAIMMLFYIALVSQAMIAKGASSSDPAEPLSHQADGQAPADLSEKARALTSSNPNERASAICAIGKMGQHAASVMPALIQLLGDATPTGRMMCDEGKWVHASGQFDESSIGKEAAKALSSIGPAAVSGLAGALRNGDWRVRANAALALGLINDERTVDLLAGASADEAWQVREQATWGMGLKGDKRVANSLLAALKDKEAPVRAQAAWALGLQGDAGAIDLLSAALKDENAQVREQAAWALGMQGDSRAIKALEVAAEDENAQVRRQASWALQMIRMK